MGEKPGPNLPEIYTGPQSRRKAILSLLQLGGRVLQEGGAFGQLSGLMDTREAEKIQAVGRLMGSETIQDATDNAVNDFIGPAFLASSQRRSLEEEVEASDATLPLESNLEGQVSTQQPEISEEAEWSRPIFDL